MSDEFDQLLAETGITFVPPVGFSPFPIRTSCAFRYHRAYRHASGMEVRVRIDSLQRIKAQLKGALPGNFSESAFFSGITNLSGGKAGVRELEADSARRFFNADWVRTAYFTPVDPQFAPDHELAVVHYYHRKDIADVYLIGLYRKGDDEVLVLGTEPPVRYPEFAQAQPVKGAPAPNAAPAHDEAFLQLWRKATALIDGCVNLDGRRLPAPNEEERRRLEEAIRLFEQAFALEPGRPGPMLFVSKAYERLGDLPRSLAAIRKAHALFPDDLVLLIELGSALGRGGLNDEAISVLRMGSRIHPSDPRVQFNLGMALLTSGNAASAIPVFQRLVELEPQGPHNERLLALAHEVAAGKKPVPKTEREVAALM
jgi:tetratricopeptide (TPR) repeat protein